MGYKTYTDENGINWQVVFGGYSSGEPNEIRLYDFAKNSKEPNLSITSMNLYRVFVKGNTYFKG